MSDFNTLVTFKSFTETLSELNYSIPVLFIGHGSPSFR